MNRSALHAAANSRFAAEVSIHLKSPAYFLRLKLTGECDGASEATTFTE